MYSLDTLRGVDDWLLLTRILSGWQGGDGGIPLGQQRSRTGLDPLEAGLLLNTLDRTVDLGAGQHLPCDLHLPQAHQYQVDYFRRLRVEGQLVQPVREYGDCGKSPFGIPAIARRV